MKIKLKEIECKQGAKSLAKILARNVSGEDAKKDPGFKKDLVKIFTKNIQSVEGIVCDEKTLKAYEKKGYSEKAARLLVFLTNLYSEIAAQVDGFKNARDVEEFFIKKNAKKDIKSSIIYEIAKAFKIEDEVQEILEQDDYISVEKAGKLAKAKVERRYRLTNDEKIKIEEARVRMLERELDEGLGDMLKLAANGIKKGAKKIGNSKFNKIPDSIKKAAKDKVEGAKYQAEEKIEKVFGKDSPEFIFKSKSKSFWQLKNLLKNSSERGNKGLIECLNYIKDNFKTPDGKEIDKIESLFKTPKLLIAFNTKRAMKRFIKDGSLNTVIFDLKQPITGEDKVSVKKLQKTFLRDISYNKMDSNTSFSEGDFGYYIVAFEKEDANSLAQTWGNIIKGKYKQLSKEEVAEAVNDSDLKDVYFHLLPPDISKLKANEVQYDKGEGDTEALEDDDEEKKESFIVYKKRIH
jgi:hypothetical protein